MLPSTSTCARAPKHLAASQTEDTLLCSLDIKANVCSQLAQPCVYLNVKVTLQTQTHEIAKTPKGLHDCITVKPW